MRKGGSVLHRCAKSRGYLCPRAGSSGSNDDDNVEGFGARTIHGRRSRALRRQRASAKFVSAKYYGPSTFCCSAERHISFAPNRKDGGGENAEAPVCLLFSKEIHSFSIPLSNPEQQTNTFRAL